MDTFEMFIIGLAGLLSGLVRILILSQHKMMVATRNARAIDLCVLTGLNDRESLRDMYGLSTTQGLWPEVTLADISGKRTPFGQITGRQWPNYAAIILALIGPFIGNTVSQLAILLSAVIQIIGWVTTARLSNLSTANGK